MEIWYSRLNLKHFRYNVSLPSAAIKQSMSHDYFASYSVIHLKYNRRIREMTKMLVVKVGFMTVFQYQCKEMSSQKGNVRIMKSNLRLQLVTLKDLLSEVLL